MEPVLMTAGQPLRVWEPIEIVVGEGIDAGKYRARIEDFINGGIVITAPEYIAGETLLRNDVDVAVNVTRDDAVYQFHSRIKQREASNRKFLVLTPPKSVRRLQRRLFCRIDILARLSYAWIKPTLEWDEYEERLKWHRTSSIDISGGGLRMKLVDEDTGHDLLLLKLDLFKVIGLPETVVGLCRRRTEERGEILAGVELLSARRLPEFFNREEIRRLPIEVNKFDNQAEARLASFVFHKQIDLRAKGLL